MKTTSCGILVLNRQHELLLCHATGTPVWDIPKGGADAGEAPVDTAMRETHEETGLEFHADALTDLGVYRYRSVKDLHLFATLTERFDLSQCVCSSHYRDFWGRSRPEMDAYEWTNFRWIERRCARRMGQLLTQTLSLPALVQALAEHPAARVPAGPLPGPVR